MRIKIFSAIVLSIFISSCCHETIRINNFDADKCSYKALLSLNPAKDKRGLAVQDLELFALSQKKIKLKDSQLTDIELERLGILEGLMAGCNGCLRECCDPGICTYAICQLPVPVIELGSFLADDTIREWRGKDSSGNTEIAKLKNSDYTQTITFSSEFIKSGEKYQFDILTTQKKSFSFEILVP